MKKTLRFALLAAVIGHSGVTLANEFADKLTERLAAVDPRLELDHFEEAPLPGFYSVVLTSGDILYVNESVDYFMFGDLYKLGGEKSITNLTEASRRESRVAAMAEIKPEDMVIFPAVGERKASIKVFTDVECGYCRKLHREVKTLNEKGVEVEYLAFPRAGAGSSAHQTMVSIWCSQGDERLQSMTRAKNGASLPEKSCDNPVLKQYALGQKLGVNGTPAIVLENGNLIPGYLPAEELVRRLGIN